MYKRNPRKQGMQQYGFTGPAQMQPIQGIAPPPAAPLQKSTTEQFTDMAKQRLMTTALDKGVDKGASMISSVMAPTSATASTAAMENAALGAAAEGGLGAAMGGLGTAMPYVGMGLLAGKALGLFSQGGYVGPLAKATYAANGEKVTAEFDQLPDNVLDAINKEKYYGKKYGQENLTDAYKTNHMINKAYEEDVLNYEPLFDIATSDIQRNAINEMNKGLQRERLINFLRSQIK